MFKNNNGFGLVEVLVAVGLLGTISLGLMRVFENGYSKNADLVARQDLREFRDELYVTMSKDNCGLVGPSDADLLSKNYVLKVTESAPKEIPELFGTSGQAYKAGDPFGQISISNIALGAPSKFSPYLKHLQGEPTSGGYIKIQGQDYYAGEIVINMKKPAGANVNKVATTVPIKFLALFTINAENKLTSCRSIAEISHTQQVCEAMESANPDLLQVAWDPVELECKITPTEKADSTASGTCSSVDVCDASNEYIAKYF